MTHPQNKGAAVQPLICSVENAGAYSPADLADVFELAAVSGADELTLSVTPEAAVQTAAELRGLPQDVEAELREAILKKTRRDAREIARLQEVVRCFVLAGLVGVTLGVAALVGRAVADFMQAMGWL